MSIRDRARELKIPETIQADLPRPVPAAKTFCFTARPNHLPNSPVPHPLRGALAIVTTLGAECDGREAAFDERQ
jgi:hypothetical protein